MHKKKKKSLKDPFFFLPLFCSSAISFLLFPKLSHQAADQLLVCPAQFLKSEKKFFALFDLPLHFDPAFLCHSSIAQF